MAPLPLSEAVYPKTPKGDGWPQMSIPIPIEPLWSRAQPPRVWGWLAFKEASPALIGGCLHLGGHKSVFLEVRDIQNHWNDLDAFGHPQDYGHPHHRLSSAPFKKTLVYPGPSPQDCPSHPAQACPPSAAIHHRCPDRAGGSEGCRRCADLPRFGSPGPRAWGHVKANGNAKKDEKLFRHCSNKSNIGFNFSILSEAFKF